MLFMNDTSTALTIVRSAEMIRIKVTSYLNNTIAYYELIKVLFRFLYVKRIRSIP